MRRLLEVGEVIAAGDFVFTGTHWREVQDSAFGVGEPLHAGDAPIYRNEPDGRAEMLEALEAIMPYILHDLNVPWRLARAAITKARGVQP